MNRLLVCLMTGLLAGSLLVAACAPAAPAPTPTKLPPVPTKAAEPTKPAAVAPTAAPAAPTKAPEPTKPAAAAAPKVDFPQKGKTITVIVPFAPGGATDVGARVLAGAMEKDLGVSFQVVNRPGAGSQVGVTELAKSKPDGYTLGMTNLPAAMTPYMDPTRQAAYTRKDLVQVANHVWDPEVIIVKADGPFKTLKDLADAAKANPEKVKMGTTGVGSDGHFATILFERATGGKFSIVQFDGAGPALTAMLGGHVDANLATIGNYGAVYKGGDIRFLGVMDTERLKFLPDLPTFRQQGYDIVRASSRGFSVPAGTPREIVEILSSAMKKAIESDEVKKKMDEMLLPQRYMNPAQYTAFWDEFEAQTKPMMDLIIVK